MGQVELSVIYCVSHSDTSLCFLIKPFFPLLRTEEFCLVRVFSLFPFSEKSLHLFHHVTHVLLFHCLLCAVGVVFMVVVLSLRLLVTEEVAPPGFRVLHWSGCAFTLQPFHLLQKNRHIIKGGKYK